MNACWVNSWARSGSAVMRRHKEWTRLTWQQGSCVTDPATGATAFQRGGLYWTQTPRGSYEVQRVWQPNIVAHQGLQERREPFAGRHFPERGMLDMRQLDPGEPWLIRRVPLVKVIDVVAFAHRAGCLDEIVGKLLQRFQLVRRQRTPDQQVTVFPVE